MTGVRAPTAVGRSVCPTPKASGSLLEASNTGNSTLDVFLVVCGCRG